MKKVLYLKNLSKNIFISLLLGNLFLISTLFLIGNLFLYNSEKKSIKIKVDNTFSQFESNIAEVIYIREEIGKND